MKTVINKALLAQLKETRDLISALLEEESYLTIEEACAFLKVPKSHLYKKEFQQQMPYIRFGRLLRYRKSDLVAFYEKSLIMPKS